MISPSIMVGAHRGGGLEASEFPGRAGDAGLIVGQEGAVLHAFGEMLG